MVIESTFSFPCANQNLIGVAHIPENPSTTGILMVSAGELQYRAGCARQLVLFARAFAERGTPVMRFDQRGVGDSPGELRGFEHLAPDISCAVEQFLELVPALKHVVLWGGCDAASAIMINGGQIDNMTGWILSNPFASDDKVKAAAIKRHYLSRIQERDFWVKLLTLKYNPLSYLKSVWLQLSNKVLGLFNASPGERDPDQRPSKRKFTTSFPEQMLAGLEGFKGDLLMVMSGRSLVRQQFDELTAGSSQWQNALSSHPLRRVDIPEADQTFSTVDAQSGFINATIQWLNDSGR